MALADLQRQVMTAILDQIRKANELTKEEEKKGKEETKKTGLPYYRRIVAESVKRNVEQQERFMDCFFASLGVASMHILSKKKQFEVD
jgi:hypothetical protein